MNKALWFGIVLLGVGVWAQQAVAPPAQTPALTFEAASIKPSAPIEGGRVMMGMRIDPGRLTAQNLSLEDIIENAYSLKPYQVTGPDWMKTERFDIVATTAAAVPRSQMAALLQPFLAQQFKLTTHRVTKDMPIYALVVAGGGIKAKPVDSGPGRFGMQLGPNGVTVEGQADLSGFADLLSRQTDRPVVDMTGLKGFYDFKLSFAPLPGGPGLMLNGARPPAAADGADAAPSLFSALPEQLGLKLEARKGPVSILVVDHCERTPVGN